MGEEIRKIERASCDSTGEENDGVRGVRRMEVLLVSGFLGSGKTTLIKHLLASKIQGIGKMALIVNEVGEVGIDGALLSGKDVDMVEITSGCICCTVKSDFHKALQEIHARVRPEFVMVEATGVALPGDILDALLEPPLNEYSRLRTLVTVVDADIFRAREMFGSFYDNQIRCADTLILNKVDLVGPEEVQTIEGSLREMNPGALILSVQHCAVDPSLLFQRNPSGKESHLHDDHVHRDFHETGFQTFSFEDGRAMDKGKLVEFLKALPPALFRLKGWVRFPDESGHLDFTGGRYRVTPMGAFHPTALTFVGRNCNEEEILKGLKECLIETSAPRR